MLGPFSQSLYSTVLDEKSDNLLPFFFRRAAFNLDNINRITTVLQYQNENLLYCCLRISTSLS